MLEKKFQLEIDDIEKFLLSFINREFNKDKYEYVKLIESKKDEKLIEYIYEYKYKKNFISFFQYILPNNIFQNIILFISIMSYHILEKQIYLSIHSIDNKLYNVNGKIFFNNQQIHIILNIEMDYSVPIFIKNKILTFIANQIEEEIKIHYKLNFI
jgi:hypothetical protein